MSVSETKIDILFLMHVHQGLMGALHHSFLVQLMESVVEKKRVLEGLPLASKGSSPEKTHPCICSGFIGQSWSNDPLRP